MQGLLDWLWTFYLTLHNGQFIEWGAWSYLALAIAVALEGPVVTLFGAAAASAGVMRPWPVFFAASAGNLLGDTGWYLLGYLGKVDWLYHLGSKFRLSEETIQHIEQRMQKHAVQVLFFAKLSMSFMIPSLISAGLIKVPIRRWFPPVFLGEMIWTGSLVLIGYHATEAIKNVEKGVGYVILGASAVFGLVILLIVRKALKNKTEKDIDGSPDIK